MVTKKLNQKQWTKIDLINWSNKYLKSKGIQNSRKESEWFLSEIYNCNRLDLYLQFDQIVAEEQLKIFKSFILRRLQNEPFQYIIKKAPFYGRDFYVNKHVLIPRPETEILIDILKKRNKVESILDVGTGSGCLAITASLENISNKIYALDNQEQVITIAKKNSDNFKCKNINFKIMDFINTIPNQKFEIVISNPPYIAKQELNFLDKDIIDYEPLNSLTDNKDGLTFYKRFAQVFDNIIKPEGILFIEFGGIQQVKSLEEIFDSLIFKVKFHEDLNNSKRIIEISKK